MQKSRFVVLAGHLNDYPLSDLLGILRHQRKTGRLLIEYPKGPAMFYFHEGELVDAQLDKLSGLQAICVALAQPPSSFNFNPVVQPSKRSIDNSLRKVVSELLGCWDENGLEIEAVAPIRSLAQRVSLAPASPSNDVLDTRRAPLNAEASASSFSRPIMAMAAAGLLLLGLSTVIAVTGRFGRRVSSAALTSSLPAASDARSLRQSSGGLSPVLLQSEPQDDARRQRELAKAKELAAVLEQSRGQESRTSVARKDEPQASYKSSEAPLEGKTPVTGEDEKTTREVAPNNQPVQVILQIENGRVVEASIGNHRSGLEAYEALALRIARQRRYPASVASRETVVINVGSN